MKKHNLIIPVIAATIALSGTAAVASPGHGGHGAPNHHTVTHVYNAPRPGHNGGHHHVVHNNHHHHHHRHGASAGDLIIATAILISAIM